MKYLVFTLLLFVGCTTQQKTQYGANRDLATLNDSIKWKLTFSDEFDNAQTAIAKGADPNCFSRAAQCSHIGWGGQKECPTLYSQQLANLNKCVWNVWSYYNHMDFGADLGKGINAFHPSMVEVKDGLLYLYADDSTYNPISCKEKFNDPEVGGYESLTNKCPFISGGIDSRPYVERNLTGMSQKYGRFEARARQTNKPGSWNAIWMMPVEKELPGGGHEHGGWPYAGEIDIVDTKTQPRDETVGGLIRGNVETREYINKGYRWKINKKHYPHLTAEQRRTTLYNNFHTYAVEWDEKNIQFIIDDWVVASVGDKELVYLMKGDIPRVLKQTPIFSSIITELVDKGTEIRIPTLPFYWLLNLTITTNEDKDEKYRPKREGYEKHSFVIDYVRIYEKCGAGDTSPQCISLPKKDTVYQYNTYKNENAYALINVWPSPQKPGEPIKVKLDLKQDCNHVKLFLMNPIGQEIKILHDGQMFKNVYEFIVEDTHSYAAGVYFATAIYDGCAPTGTAKGNHVFKFQMIR